MTRGAAPPARRWRNLAPTREADARQPRWVAAFVAGLLVAAAPFLLYLLVQGETVAARYRIETLRGMNEKLLQAERRFQVEAARLQAPARVEAEARERLGLVRPPAGRQVVLHVAPSRGGLMARAPDAPRRTARR